MEEDIQLNVKAQYDSLNGLLAKLEETKKALGKMSKARINFDIKKDIQKSADPIMRASEYLTEALKNVNKAKNDLVKAMVSGDTKNIEKAKGQLDNSQKFARDVIKTIEHTKAFNESQQKITSQYEEFQKQSIALQEYANNVKLARESLARFELSLDPTKKKLAGLQEYLAKAEEEFVRLKSAGDQTAYTENNIKRIKKQMDKLKKSTKDTSSWAEKLIGRIRNISIYRMIRTGIKWVTSGFQEGLNNFVQYSDSVNSTVSELNASLTQIKNTMGIAFASVLQTVQPIITAMADSLVDLINAFNLALAKMQGKNVYTKAKKNVDDYANSLKKANQLSFDSFEVLNKDANQTQPSQMFEEGNVAEDTSQTSKVFEQFLTIVQKLWSILSKIWTDILEPAMPALLGIANALLTIISTIVTIIDKLNLIYPIIFAIVGLKLVNGVSSLIGSFSKLGQMFTNVIGWFQNYNMQCALATKKTEILRQTAGAVGIALASVAGAVVACIANWDNMSAQTKGWVVAIAVLTGALASLAFAVYASMQQWAKAISVASGVVATGATVMTAISGFAEGGIPEKSELFYMNEYGVPEALVNTGGSQTNVINITQLAQGMKQGFVEAIYETGLIDAMQNRLIIEGNNVNDNAFARAIFPALKTESERRGGNQL